MESCLPGRIESRVCQNLNVLDRFLQMLGVLLFPSQIVAKDGSQFYEKSDGHTKRGEALFGLGGAFLTRLPKCGSKASDSAITLAQRASPLHPTLWIPGKPV